MSAVCGVACTASINWYYGAARDDGAGRIPIADQSQCIFLFDGSELCSSTPSASAMLADHTGDTDWDRLRQALADRFPTFPAEPDVNIPAGPTLLTAPDATDP